MNDKQLTYRSNLLDKLCTNWYNVYTIYSQSETAENLSGKGIEKMKSIGIVRKVDDLGRIVLPIELRRTFDLAVKDSIEIYTEDDKIILKKYQRKCIFCGATENLVDYKDKSICTNCISEIKGAK